SNAPIVLFFVLVLDRVGSGIAAQPELLDKLVALFVVGKLLERGALFVGDDPPDVLVKPTLELGTKLLLQGLFTGLALLFRKRALERVYFFLLFSVTLLLFGIGRGSGILGQTEAG